MRIGMPGNLKDEAKETESKRERQQVSPVWPMGEHPPFLTEDREGV